MENHRLLLVLEQAIRTVNSEVLNPEIPQLTIDDLSPVIQMVANVRAAYLKKLIEVSNAQSEGLPAAAHVAELRELRSTYDECLNGAQALETAIQRGYLDVAEPQRK